MKSLCTSFAIALALALGAALVASAQSPNNITVTQIDTSRFPQVDVFVSVTDANGNPVRSVAPNAFHIEENGQPMAVTAGARPGEQGPVNTVLVIDHSGSMSRGDKMAGAKQAASAFVNLMRSGDKTALIQFDTQIDTLQPFTEDKSALLGAIQPITPRGNTALYDALNQAANQIETMRGRKAIIVVTDGMDNSSQVSRDGLVKTASASGVSIYTIGLGEKGVGTSSQDGIDESALQEVASASLGSYFYRPDANQLSNLYRQLSTLLQNEYKLTYVSPNALRDGLKRGIVVTTPGAAARANFNPGGVIPEVSPQSSSWLLFFIALLVLVALLFAPTGLRLAREHNRHGAVAPRPSFQKGSRIALKGNAPIANKAAAMGVSTPRGRIKIKNTGAGSERSRLPWDEHADKR